VEKDIKRSKKVLQVEIGRYTRAVWINKEIARRGRKQKEQEAIAYFER